MNIDNYIAVEFSLSQKCFHKQSVYEMLETNRKNMMQRVQTDYSVIAILPNNELADKFISMLRSSAKDYSIYKNIEGDLVV